jgi:Sap, sulfolipid-1-addressing protein
VITHNLLGAACTLAYGNHAVTWSTRAARYGVPARKPVLHLSADWQWHNAWKTLGTTSSATTNPPSSYVRDESLSGKPITIQRSFTRTNGQEPKGSVPAVWSTVLGLALLVTVNPVRLGVILLVISRPRPVQNLFAYWVGSLMVGIPSFLVPLMVLHVTPTFASFTKDLATRARPRTPSPTTLRSAWACSRYRSPC